MISPETPQDILAEIVKELHRIADALEAFNHAAIWEGDLHVHVHEMMKKR